MSRYNFFALLDESEKEVKTSSPKEEVKTSPPFGEVKQMLHHLRRTVCPDATWEMAVDTVIEKKANDVAIIAKKKAEAEAKAKAAADTAAETAAETAAAIAADAAAHAKRLLETSWKAPVVYTTPKKPLALKKPSDEGWTVVK